MLHHRIVHGHEHPLRISSHLAHHLRLHLHPAAHSSAALLHLLLELSRLSSLHSDESRLLRHLRRQLPVVTQVQGGLESLKLLGIRLTLSWRRVNHADVHASGTLPVCKRHTDRVLTSYRRLLDARRWGSVRRLRCRHLVQCLLLLLLLLLHLILLLLRLGLGHECLILLRLRLRLLLLLLLPMHELLILSSQPLPEDPLGGEDLISRVKWLVLITSQLKRRRIDLVLPTFVRLVHLGELLFRLV